MTISFNQDSEFYFIFLFIIDCVQFTVALCRKGGHSYLWRQEHCSTGLQPLAARTTQWKLYDCGWCTYG